jgi:hypothetical protein
MTRRVAAWTLLFLLCPVATTVAQVETPATVPGGPGSGGPGSGGPDPAGLEDALQRGRVPADAIERILASAEEIDWDRISPGADLDAVAFSLAYAEREGRLPATVPDTARFVSELARESASLAEAGFSRRDVARTMVQSVRANLDSAEPSPSASAPGILQRASREQIRSDDRAAAQRRDDSRGGGRPAGVGPPGDRGAVRDGQVPGSPDGPPGLTDKDKVKDKD